MFSFKILAFLLILSYFNFTYAQDAALDMPAEQSNPLKNNKDINEVVSQSDDLDSELFEEEVIQGEQASDEEILIEQIENLNKVNDGNFTLRPFIYNQGSRRDPFTPRLSEKKKNNPKVKVIDRSVLPELEKYRIDSFILTSVLWSVNDPKALVQDPASKIHLVKKNSRIGTKNGYVAQIREGEIVVVEEEVSEDGEPVFTTQVLKIGR